MEYLIIRLVSFVFDCKYLMQSLYANETVRPIIFTLIIHTCHPCSDLEPDAPALCCETAHDSWRKKKK